MTCAQLACQRIALATHLAVRPLARRVDVGTQDGGRDAGGARDREDARGGDPLPLRDGPLGHPELNRQPASEARVSADPRNRHGSRIPQVDQPRQAGSPAVDADPERGRRIRSARERAGFASGAALARELRVSKGLVSQWEVGLKAPGRDNLLRLAQLTGVSAAYLLGRTDAIPQSLLVDDPVKIRIVLAVARLPREAQEYVAELLGKGVDVFTAFERKR